MTSGLSTSDDKSEAVNGMARMLGRGAGQKELIS